MIHACWQYSLIDLPRISCTGPRAQPQGRGSGHSGGRCRARAGHLACAAKPGLPLCQMPGRRPGGKRSLQGRPQTLAGSQVVLGPTDLHIWSWLSPAGDDRNDESSTSTSLILSEHGHAQGCGTLGEAVSMELIAVLERGFDARSKSLQAACKRRPLCLTA